MTLPDWAIYLMNFIVVPALGWIGHLHNKTNRQDTKIAVVETKVTAHGEKYDRIMDKLDDIEKALRRKD